MRYFLGSLPAIIILGIVVWLVIPVVRLHFASKRRLRRIEELTTILKNPNITFEQLKAAIDEMCEISERIGKC